MGYPTALHLLQDKCARLLVLWDHHRDGRVLNAKESMQTFSKEKLATLRTKHGNYYGHHGGQQVSKCAVPLHGMRRRRIHNVSQMVPSQVFAGDDRDSNFYTGSGTKIERSLVRRQDMRLIPLCASVYLMCFLDRSNIGILPLFPTFPSCSVHISSTDNALS